MEYLSDLTQEKEFLSEIQKLLAKNIDLIQEKASITLESLKETSQLYSEGDAGFYMEIPVAQQRYEAAKKDLLDNQKASLSPYFGKTILTYMDKENGEGDHTFYFGKVGISDLEKDATNQVITDWRAPIADVYYSSKLGETRYEAPKGEIIVDLKLKTTIKIKNGELLELYDAEVVTNDELLSEYLSQNKDTVLNDIIATIQEDQNRIIRRPLSLNLIVQGVAGSGKTTVALHRVAYLLYNFKEQLKFNNICLIAANKLFLGYITGMLPDLDVPAIKQYTIDELLISSIKTFSKKFSKAAVHIDALPVTQNDCYANDTYIDSFEAFKAEKNIEIFNIASVSFLHFELLNHREIQRVVRLEGISWLQKAHILESRIKDRMMILKNDIIIFVCQSRFNEEVARVVDEFFSLGGGAILEDTLSHKFLSFTKKFTTIFTKRVKQYSAQRLFTEFTNNPCKNMLLNDLACYLQMLIAIHGPENLTDIRHIVIDEAQDFSIVVYYALKAMYPKATFTVVGDIMQNIRYNGLASWDILQHKIFGERTEYASLVKSYRNTIEISEFAQSTVERLTGKTIEIEPIIRHGQPVGIHPYASPPERLDEIKQIVTQFTDSGFHMNAIICKEEEEAEKLYNKLYQTTDIKLLNPESGKLEQGTYIVSLANSKGLEFDCVIVWDYDSFEACDVNKLYVALTRALHRLHVFSNNRALITE